MRLERSITDIEPSPSVRKAAHVEPEFSSFRDPSGFLFWSGGEIFRCIAHRYQRQFQHASESGLYTSCVKDGLLLPFEQSGRNFGLAQCHAVLKPTLLPQITYPYEWCFDQLKDAALLTLRVHLRALEHGMVLKDASIYNVQTLGAGRPRLIDHLSFDFLTDHGAWPAYGQFCRHFLAPLTLMSYVDPGLGRMLQIHLDGIPLDLASRLLPISTRFRLGLQMHLHLHAKMVSKHGHANKKVEVRTLSAEQLAALARSLERTVAGLRPSTRTTEWGDYASHSHYSSRASSAKLAAVRQMVGQVKPRVIWDIGGNDGQYSRTLTDLADRIVCMDADPVAVNRNYLACRDGKITNVTPLVVDLTNPSPDIGFANRERPALVQRDRPDLAMALALIHHLAITHNLPFAYVARYLAGLCRHLIVEFVPKQDPQVKRLLLNRKDTFEDYGEDQFRAAFSEYFVVLQEISVADTERKLFLMQERSS
jgi:hypothetical protein